jgi:hypothetical protein
MVVQNGPMEDHVVHDHIQKKSGSISGIFNLKFLTIRTFRAGVYHEIGKQDPNVFLYERSGRRILSNDL